MGFDLVGRVGLAALELGQCNRAFEAFDIRFEPLGEPGFIELVSPFGRNGADEIGLGVDWSRLAHWSNTITLRATSPCFIFSNPSLTAFKRDALGDDRIEIEQPAHVEIDQPRQIDREVVHAHDRALQLLAR